MLEKVPCALVDIPPIEVKVANGQSILCSQAAHKFDWWIQGHSFTIDALVLPTGAYDMVLGMDWLEQFRPMTCDWQEKWVQFHYHGTMVKLFGVVPQSEPDITSISEQLVKAAKGNDIWAMAVIQSVSKHADGSVPSIPAAIKMLLISMMKCSRTPSLCHHQECITMLSL